MIGDILQPTHLLFVLVIALLVLGPKRLPEVGRALGRGLRDFRSALSTDELHEQMVSTTASETPPATNQAVQSTAAETPASPSAPVASEPQATASEAPREAAASAPADRTQ